MTANRRNINDLRCLIRNSLIVPHNLDIRKNRTVSYKVRDNMLMPLFRIPPKNIGKDNKILSLHIKMWDFLGKGMFFFVLLFNSTNFALQLRVKR